MNWKKRFLKQTKTESQKMAEIFNKQNPSEEEQKKFIEWVHKHNPKAVEDAVKKVEAIETPT